MNRKNLSEDQKLFFFYSSQPWFVMNVLIFLELNDIIQCLNEFPLWDYTFRQYLCPELFLTKGSDNILHYKKNKDDKYWGILFSKIKFLSGFNDTKIKDIYNLFERKIRQDEGKRIREHVFFNKCHSNIIIGLDAVISQNNFTFDIKTRQHCIKLFSGVTHPGMQNLDYSANPIFDIIKPEFLKCYPFYRQYKYKVYGYIYIDVTEIYNGMSIIFFNKTDGIICVKKLSEVFHVA